MLRNWDKILDAAAMSFFFLVMLGLYVLVA